MAYGRDIDAVIEFDCGETLVEYYYKIFSKALFNRSFEPIK